MNKELERAWQVEDMAEDPTPEFAQKEEEGNQDNNPLGYSLLPPSF